MVKDGSKFYLQRLASLEQFFFSESLLQPFSSSFQGLIDGFRRGGEAALQNGEGKADCPLAPVVGQGFGSVKFFAHILGDSTVEDRFLVGEGVTDRVSDSFGEKWLAVKLEQFLFDQTAHQVGSI